MQTDLHQSDPHQDMRQIIDKSLMGEASPQEQQALRKHLLACAACQKYASDSRRAIVSLHGFSFAADPGLQAKVHASLALRASATAGRAAWPPAHRRGQHHRSSAHHRRLLGRIAHGQSARRSPPPRARCSSVRRRRLVDPPLAVLLPVPARIASCFLPDRRKQKEVSYESSSVFEYCAEAGSHRRLCHRLLCCAHRVVVGITQGHVQVLDAGARQDRWSGHRPARRLDCRHLGSLSRIRLRRRSPSCHAARPVDTDSGVDSESARISSLLRTAPADPVALSRLRAPDRDRATLLLMVRVRKSLAAVQPNTFSGAGCPVLAQLGWVVSRESDTLPVFPSSGRTRVCMEGRLVGG